MKDIKSSKEITTYVSDLGVSKATYAPIKTRLLAMLAGMFIAIGGIASSKVNLLLADSPFKSIFAAATFTIGIVLVLVAGAELFTGNILITVGYLDKKLNKKQVLTNWCRVYVWNFIGSILFALLTYLALKDSEDYANYFKNIVVSKTSLGFFKALILGILCNILVCLSVWCSYASSEGAGKFLLATFPIFIFVLMGYEHIVANMFYFTVGYLFGSDVSVWTAILQSFIPVTIGNIIGGAFIGMVYQIANKN
ncbi:MAG: formate/nitrite transporter family protein [Ezakiella sp.]|nr:formate/nitrite transporter family protein [Ezakiella sp.]MDD7471367.1 formate/nitrite transporter family protein [Bacillota bacterium]MDY3923538.1 formate/nitrite transporter family protein [Ezakiella sp.]